MTDELKLKDGDKCRRTGDPCNFVLRSGNWVCSECSRDKPSPYRQAASPGVQSEPVIEGKKADLCANTAEKSGTCATPAADAPTAETASAMNMTETTPAKTSTTALPEPVPSRESTLPELDELLKAAKAATPGPWEWEYRSGYYDLMDSRRSPVLDDGSACGEYSQSIQVPGPDASYIALANPAAVIELISALTAARAQVAERDQIITALKTCVTLGVEESTHWFKRANELAAQVALLQQQEPRWRSVATELPPLEQVVDVWMGNARMPSLVRLYVEQAEGWLWHFAENDVGYRGDDGCPIEVAGYEAECVTHWMPIPTLPYAPPEKETGG